MSNAPAGWYPVDGSSQRYWDGVAWTEHVAPLTEGPGSQAQARQPQSEAQPPGPMAQPPAPIAQPPGPMAQPAQPPAPIAQPPGPMAQPPAPTQPPEPSGTPGSGFPAGVGDPHQPVPPGAQQAWGSASADIPYSRPAPAPFRADAAPVSSADDRSMAVLCHVLGIFTGFIGPLIVWLVKKDTSPFVDMHGKAALNFQLSLLIYWFVTFIAIFLIIGLFLIPILFVLGLILPIVAAVTSNKGEAYKYPLAIPFLS